MMNYLKKISNKKINIFQLGLFFGGLSYLIHSIYLHSCSSKLIKERDREKLLRGIIETTTSTFDINQIRNSIVNQVGKFFNADRCLIRDYDENTNTFGPLSIYSEYLSSSDVKSLINVKIGPEMQNFFFDKITRGGGIIVSNDTDKFIETNNLKNTLTEKFIRDFSIKSGILRILIVHKNKILAIFAIHYTREKVTISKDDIDFIKIIANQVGIAIYQAQLFDNLTKTAERENLLRSLISNTLLSNNLDEAIRKITTETGKMFDVDRTCFMFYDSDLQSFSEIKGEYRKREDMVSTEGKVVFEKDIEQFLINEFFIKKNNLIFDSYENPEFPELLKLFIKNLNIKTAIAAPVFLKDRPIGIIILSNIESSRKWSKEEIDFLMLIAQQTAISINLFQLNERLSKNLGCERAIKDIILEAKKLENHDLILNYLLNKLAEIYNVKRVLHLHYNEKHNLFVKNEALIDKNLKSLLNQQILASESTIELEPKAFGECVIINDVNAEIENSGLKQFLLNNGIQAFMIYPKPKRFAWEEQDEIIATTMICSSTAKKWSLDDIRNFKLIIDTSSLVYFEILHIKETEELKNTFLATLTHDLRSPLNAEQKALEAILSKKLGTSLDNFSEFLEEIYKTNEELLRIVNNILTVYHFESGRYELNLQPNKIKDVIEDSVNSMKVLAKDQQSEIITNIQPDLPEFMFDRDEIQRVITNLISNAIKHTKKGISIDVSAKRINNEIELAVSDDGSGISEAEKPNIFQRYPTTKRKIGTGLGLYLSKQIVNAHNGKIWFETEIDKGTTFYFNLPIT